MAHSAPDDDPPESSRQNTVPDEPTDDRRWLVRRWPNKWSLPTVAAVLALDERACAGVYAWSRLFDDVERALRSVLPS